MPLIVLCRHMLTLSVGLVGCLAPSVWLSVCPTKDLKVLKLGVGNGIGISYKWYGFRVERSKVKVRVRVRFNSTTTWVRTLWVSYVTETYEIAWCLPHVQLYVEYRKMMRVIFCLVVERCRAVVLISWYVHRRTVAAAALGHVDVLRLVEFRSVRGESHLGHCLHYVVGFRKEKQK